jgi:CheY-like chemotaxis protein
LVSSRYRPFTTFQQAFTAATEMKNLARMSPGNAWVNERLRLTSAPETEVPLVHERVKRILIVESDAALAFLLKSALEMQGYHTQNASNQEDAQAALAQIDSHGQPTIDMVLMDAMIQDQKVGWDLCRQIKQTTPTVQVVFLSTLDARDEALAAGADLYMPKPFELVPLLLWVDQLLRRH